MKTFAVSLFALSAFIHPTVILAQWQIDGTPLSTAANSQGGPTIVSDGAGGAIVTWQDSRSDLSGDVYAQRVSASGVVQWTADGVALCTAANEQSTPTIVSDGAGGAIVTWYDARDENGYDIYAQRVNASGVVQWAANGVALCTAANDQNFSTIVADGTGGAIVTWQDPRSGNEDIYTQRVNASGTVQWTADGVALCTAALWQYSPTIVSDGAGGAIVSWFDLRSGVNLDIYAQRVNFSGTVQWTANGVAICTASNSQHFPTIVSDGAGGAIVAWVDSRAVTESDIYAQRVNASGAVQWAANGVALCTATDQQSSTTNVSDGAGGAIVTWNDFRNHTDHDVYAQRVNGAGVVQWAANGVPLATAANGQDSPTIVSDGAGGAIVTWQDQRGGGHYDIYAQRVNASGAVQWAANGLALCTAASAQYNPTIVSDGVGGAIVTWSDLRDNGITSDVYAQRVLADGSTPTSAGDAPAIGMLSVLQNHPNPFGGRTEFEIQLREKSNVRIEVFDVAGRRVRKIEAGDIPAGSRTIAFVGDDDAGRPLASGVYFFRVTAGGATIARKMVLVR